MKGIGEALGYFVGKTFIAFVGASLAIWVFG